VFCRLLVLKDLASNYSRKIAQWYTLDKQTDRQTRCEACEKLMRGVSRILGFKMTNDLLNILQINLFVSMCHRSNLVRTNLRSPPKIT
jgi:hypothetical protein